MEFEELKNRMMANVRAYEKKHNVHFDTTLSFIKLMEEVGEFAEAITIYEGTARAAKHLPAEQAKEKLSVELADVIGFALLCADLYDIDIEAAIIKKWLGRESSNAPENADIVG